MRQVTDFHEITPSTREARREGKLVGFVPTMGALHDGHLSLIRRARTECDHVVVSIFVNPIQFEPGEDLDTYPRTLERDLEICRDEGVDVVFTPNGRDMYPPGFKTFVEVENLTRCLCGRTRPTHFRGVTTVCTKLFEIVRPDVAYLGQKDFQQAVIVRRVVIDLNIPVDIRLCDIVREDSGLAMSSRNAYMTDHQREVASALYEGLCRARELYDSGERRREPLIEAAMTVYDRERELRVEYLELCDTDNLECLQEVSRPACLAVAAHVGKARLIDNVILGDLPW
ncbi:MAG: pantoate--beta-alanine ligase [Planctomycetota bacterium]